MKKKICVRAKLSLGLCSFHLVIFIAVVALGQTDASSWRTLPNAPVAPDNGRFDDVFFINPETGWIANVAAGKIYKTTDGGENWIEQIEARNVFGYFVGFRCVGFASEQLGWAGNINLHNIPVARRSLFETRDGGRTWANISDRISGPDPAGICGLWVVNDRLVSKRYINFLRTNRQAYSTTKTPARRLSRFCRTIPIRSRPQRRLHTISNKAALSS